MIRGGKWLAARTATFFEALHAPEAAFSRPLEGPSYLVPLALLGSAFVLLAHLQAPMSIHWAVQQMRGAGAPEGQIAAGLAAMRQSQRWAIAVVPVLLFGKWLLFAGILWLTAQLFLAAAGFSRTLSVVAFSYAPILFRDAVIFLILRIRGWSGLEDPGALNVAIGLNLLWPRLPLPWSALAGNINLFEFWYLALLASGMAAASRVRLRSAWGLVLPVWLFAVLIQTSLLALSLALRSAYGELSANSG